MPPVSTTFAKIIIITRVETDRLQIQSLALQREEENMAFRGYLTRMDSDELDATVHRLNEEITPLIDCTECGACCKSLMINVTAAEVDSVAVALHQGAESFKQNYIEESLQGQMIVNTIPCHFLEGTVCSIYENRFQECREFPHLHRRNFKDRLFGTLTHYAICPIIFNVVESLKIETGFKTNS